MEARIRLAIDAVDDLSRLVDGLSRRVEALEAAQKAEDDAEDQAADADTRSEVCVYSDEGASRTTFPVRAILTADGQMPHDNKVRQLMTNRLINRNTKTIHLLPAA